MQTNLKEKEAAHALVEVTADATEVDAAFEQVLQRVRREVSVPGFRPGKAPRGVLIKRVGEENFANEVRDALVDRSYPQAMREHELSPVHAHAHGGAPQAGEAFTFELHVDLYPDVELPDLDEIVIDAQPDPVTDDMVQETVENLRREHATQVPADRPVEATDAVTIQTVGEDDQPQETGSTMPVDMETVGDAIAEQFLGTSIGEVVELKLGGADEGEEADAQSTDEEGEGASTTTMRVRIEDVKAKEKPEPDEEFAKTLGFDDWDTVLAEIRKGLEAQARERAEESQREEFTDKLVEATDVELPEYLVNRRKLQLLENLGEDLKQQGMTLDDYLAHLGGQEGGREQFDEQLADSARRSVTRELVLEKILEARDDQIEVSDAEFTEALQHVASREGKDPGSFRQERGDEWVQNYRHLLRRDKALRAAVAERVAASGTDAPAAEPASAEGADEAPAGGDAG